jgi:hypothetical protein
MYRFLVALCLLSSLTACGSSRDDDDDDRTPVTMQLICGGMQAEHGFINFDITADANGTVLLFNDPDTGAPSMRTIPPGHRCQITGEPRE